MNKIVLSAAFMLAAVATATAAPAQTIVVKASDVVSQAEDTVPTNNWVSYTRNLGSSSFVSGPAAPPLGAGSLQLVTLAATDKVQVFNYDQIGTPLTDINGIGYSTYRSAGDFVRASINIEVDYNGPLVAGGYTTLAYEPYFNGSPVAGSWQSWDAYNSGLGLWWSSRAYNGVLVHTPVTWSTIVAAWPGAYILGGFGVNQGSNNPALVSAVDALSLSTATEGTVTYNFEPNLAPANKDQCRNGGWQAFNTPAFKNQGDCVSFIATGGRH